MTTQEKRPVTGSRWEQTPIPDAVSSVHPRSSAWIRGRLIVISSLADMELPGGGVGPTWLVTISVLGRKRADDHEVRKALRDFGMIGAEEDNHTAGVTRGFFLPVDPARRGLCECKTDETTIVEPDGYTWSDNGDPELKAWRPQVRARRWGRHARG